jgi:hypothetical protein
VNTGPEVDDWFAARGHLFHRAAEMPGDSRGSRATAGSPRTMRFADLDDVERSAAERPAVRAWCDRK